MCACDEERGDKSEQLVDGLERKPPACLTSGIVDTSSTQSLFLHNFS